MHRISWDLHYYNICTYIPSFFVWLFAFWVMGFSWTSLVIKWLELGSKEIFEVQYHFEE